MTLTVGQDRVHLDLGAERVIAAEKGIRKIAVEIKMFRPQAVLVNRFQQRELYQGFIEEIVQWLP